MKKIAFLILTALLLVSSAQAQKKSVKRSELEKIVKKAYEELAPVGLSVAVVKDGKAEFFSYGQRNANTGEHVTDQSLFNIASCTKAFTATAVAMLVEEGKLSWNDKVIDYIPEFRLDKPFISRELNIADILAHRSGLSTFTGDLLWYHTHYDDEEVIERMQFLPVENDFREDYGYQNNMFMIAGEIIERITGKSWSEYITEKLFLPLNMANTLPSNDEITDNTELAEPHLEGQVVTLYDFNATKPAASIHSNVEDLANWVAMLLNKGQFNGQQVVDEKALDRCFKPHNLLSVSESMKKQGTHFRAYGLGWSMYDFKGTKIIEHNGGMPGYISKVTIVPEENLGFVILNNSFEVFIHNTLKYEFLKLYLNPADKEDYINKSVEQKEKYEKRKQAQKQSRINARVENTVPSLSPEEYKGIYEDKMYGKAKVEMVNGKPVLTLLPAKDVFTSEMKHWHYDTFRIDFKDPFLPFGLVTFDFNSIGEITGFKMDLPINDFHFKNLYFKKISEE